MRGTSIERKEQRIPTNIAIVLDRSGSMTGQKIEQAKQAAITAVNYLNDQDIISIVATTPLLKY
ncbi:MAG: VWA domain-containing protein [Thiotrichaceae bacterium]